MKYIRVDDLAKEWMRDPAFRREYEALEEEFALIAAMLKARSRAGLTQAQVARRMKTTQTAVARLESGRTKPSTRTLERFARATGHRLIIGFEPLKGKVEHGRALARAARPKSPGRHARKRA
jgi:ribosome-binding protein aMBF1 (putative translation factor)